MNIELKHKHIFASVILSVTAIWFLTELSFESLVALLAEAATTLLFVIHLQRIYTLLLILLLSLLLGAAVFMLFYRDPRPDAIVQQANLEFRNGPGTGYPVVGEFSKDTHLHILAKNDDHFIYWLKVRAADGRWGWVYMDREDLWINAPLTGVATEFMPPLQSPAPLCHP